MTSFKFKSGAALGIIAMLSACGGGDNNGQTVTTAPPTAGTPTPSPTPTSTCSLSSRQEFVKAVIDEWYLFPELVVANVNPSQFSTVQDYIDALTATARAQDKDRNFTYITSIAEENAFFQSGSSAGFGFRLSFSGGNQLFIIDSYEGAPALAAGIDRGTEILAVGTTVNNLQTVSSLISGGSSGPLINALGPDDAGVSRVLRVRDSAGTRNVTVTKAEFALPPISPRFGVRIIDDRGKKVGYVNLRTFIDTAEPALENAFAQFRAQNVTDVIIDFRYNGGGLVRTAELMGDLLGRNRNASDVYSRTTFRASKASNNSQRNFQTNSNSVAPAKIAVIGSGRTASASELVTNSMAAYLGADLALVGSNTFGKPVGQIAIDEPDCDDRMRVVAFKTENKDGEGEYFSGLSTTLDTTCSAPDTLSIQMGDPGEGSTRQALDFIAGDSCTAIASSGQSGLSTSRKALSEANELLIPRIPSPYQREVPGSF
ncbi:S41 family peptidase [Sphingorhabdus sp. Alg239-R122]|uniref:S41 family peptidase n=1 Tax=Sphingorhabdus sp. Alg239-R122 TaxID=2305989 RepID=UPI0013DD413E|nr:S41 family peptidase [Sphingorhabdus sp. Alg239-R122]